MSKRLREKLYNAELSNYQLTGENKKLKRNLEKHERELEATKAEIKKLEKYYMRVMAEFFSPNTARKMFPKYH